MRQHLCINQNEKATIVVLSAPPKPNGLRVLDDTAFLGAAVKALR